MPQCTDASSTAQELSKHAFQDAEFASISAPFSNASRSSFYSVVPIGSYFVLYSTQFLQKAGVIRLQWGWTAREQSLLSFWWLNLGPWLLLLVGTLVLLLVRRRWLLLGEFGFYAILFLAFSWFMLAPWDWDNIKLLIWPSLGMLAVVWRCLPAADVAERLPLSQRYGLQIGYVIAALVLGLGGTVSVLSSLSPEQDSTVVYQSRELWNMEGAVRALPHDAVFIAAPTYNHALTYLGRSRLLGYEGHVWSHGIDASSVSAQQMRIYSGDADWQNLARELQATHLVWGPQEQSQYGNRELPWRTQLQNISDVPEVEIYALN